LAVKLKKSAIYDGAKYTSKVSQWLKSLLEIKSVAKATTNSVAKATTTNKVSQWLKSLLEIKSVTKITTIDIQIII
jgi:hypothetical protein